MTYEKPMDGGTFSLREQLLQEVAGERPLMSQLMVHFNNLEEVSQKEILNDQRFIDGIINLILQSGKTIRERVSRIEKLSQELRDKVFENEGFLDGMAEAILESNDDKSVNTLVSRIDKLPEDLKEKMFVNQKFVDGITSLVLATDKKTGVSVRLEKLPPALQSVLRSRSDIMMQIS